MLAIITLIELLFQVVNSNNMQGLLEEAFQHVSYAIAAVAESDEEKSGALEAAMAFLLG